MPDPTASTTPTPAPSFGVPREFDLGEHHGTATAEVCPDGTGAVLYTVTGHRISGTVSIRVANARASRVVEWVRVGFGIDTDDERPPDRWPDRLTVNGVSLCEYSEIRVADLPVFNRPGDDRRGLRVRRYYGVYGGTQPAPATTIARTLAVLDQIFADFTGRADLAQLHRAAGANEARIELKAVRKRIASLDSAIADSRSRRRINHAYAQQLLSIVENHPWSAEHRQLFRL